MSGGYTAVTSLDLVTTGQLGTIWRPRSPRKGRCGLILLPGSGNPQGYIDSVGQKASMRLAAALAGVGIPTITSDFYYNSWGNDNAMGAITAAWTVLKAQFPDMNTDKVCLLGGSMGGGAVARYSILHPENVAAVVGIIPAFDYRYEFENIAGIDAPFRAAWGMGGGDPFPTAADNAANYTAAVGVPLLAGYASDDTIVPSGPVIAYTESVGGTAINLGALGHTDAAIGAMPLDTVAQFLAANGA